jgi:hypothetical protein
MAQKGIIRNTTTAEISASDLAAIFHGLIGESGILDQFNNLTCTKISDNSVQLDSGVYSLSGYLLHVQAGTAVTLTVDSGTAGQNRNDLVVAELVKNGGGAGIDSLAFKVIKGTSTSGTPVDPALTQQDVNSTGVTRQEALYRLKLVGVTLIAIETVASTLNNIVTLKDRAIVESGGNNAEGFYKKYGDGTMEAYGRKPIFLDVTTAYGSLYRTDVPLNINYPTGAVFDLTNCMPTVVISAKDALIQRYNDSTSTYFGVYAIKPTSVTNQSVTFEWVAKGRWKP